MLQLVTRSRATPQLDGHGQWLCTSLDGGAGEQRLKANPRYLAQQNTWTTKECCRWSLQTNQTHFSTWTFPPSCVVAIHHCCHTCSLWCWLWWPWTCRRRRKLCNIVYARNYIIIPVWWSGWKANTWPEPKHVKFKGGDENENESSPGTRRVVCWLQWMCLLEGASDTWSTMCGEEGGERNDKYSK